ncbi:hypothetical protein EF912_32260 [Streptomyces sp. WAC07061]|uniref:hypothetical protein n=1 Tax=Streptomyces sp. WAC07061 TaxID=2487410 RepID=UPI000F7AD7ED|nr:hypothetical protein [Streptomyces sp. WAC07061]RSS40460.1 hypothetical protein EF912_32260 [Streptomyces sp. WAC07061]
MRAPTAAASPARSAVRRTAVVVTALLAGVAVTTAPAGAAGRVPDPLNVSASSAAGVVTGAPACPSGPLTDGRLLTGSASLNPGVFSSLPSQLGVSLPFRVGAPQAALPGDDARVALSNARGTLTLALEAGTCSSPTLSYNGTTVTGSGTWTVIPDSTTANAYRGATGTGSFTVTADATPGTGKLWSLDLTGPVSLLQPQVAVTHRAYWGGLGNYLSRTLSVEYRIRNTGSGDAFNVKLLDAPPTGPGITRLGPVPQTVGSIRSGATASVVVRYRVCGIAVVGCRFTADTQTSLTDALDGNPHTETVPVTVQVPIAPLP